MFCLLEMSFDNGLRFPLQALRKSSAGREGHGGCQPELRFAISVRDMDMNTRLFPGKEEPTERSVENDCWSHPRALPLAQCPSGNAR
jgi:hypothetical protein